MWFRKKRIVVDDKEFFEGADERPARDETIPLRPVRRPDTIVRREDTRVVPIRPKSKAASQRRPARRINDDAPRRDVFEDEMFKIKPAPQARKVPEDAVFNVSNLPGAQKEKKRPAPKKRAEREEDDLFDIH